MSDLHTLSAIELGSLIRTRKLSPVELMKSSLARAERLQPQLNCFITLCGDRALEQARQAEERVMAGERLGRLHGIPYTVKDLVNTQGVRTTFGTTLCADNVPTESAPSVERLEA